VGQTELSYLAPLFDLASALLSGEGGDGSESFGLGQVDPNSSLARDDDALKGYAVSHIVAHAIGAGVDHALALRDYVAAGQVTNAAPWTLLRGVMEPSALAVWMLAPASRSGRRERALRVWYTDMLERGSWETDTGAPAPEGEARTGRQRAEQVAKLARSLGLKESSVAVRVNYAEVIGKAGASVGHATGEARARWRECSGFAHGRTWPLLRRSTPEAAEPAPGGYTLAVTFAEEYHRAAARLTTDLLAAALDTFAAAAAPP